MAEYKLGVTGLHTIEQLRRQIQLLSEQSTTLDVQEVIMVMQMELLLYIYDGLDMMDTRLRDIEGHLSSLSSSDANRDWDAEHNPFGHGG
jgi:hypothetical protein